MRFQTGNKERPGPGDLLRYERHGLTALRRPTRSAPGRVTPLIAHRYQGAGWHERKNNESR